MLYLEFFVWNNDKNLYDGKFEGMECSPILEQLFYVFTFSLATLSPWCDIKLAANFAPGTPFYTSPSRLKQPYVITKIN
jgi:hypothetical protein